MSTNPVQRGISCALVTIGLLLGTAGVVLGQSSQPPKPPAPGTADQPPPAGPPLFQPLGTFDLTPDQQRMVERLRSDPSSGPIQVLRVNLAVPRTADAINFNVTPDANMMLSTRSRSDRAPDDYSWMGADSSGANSAALVVKDGQVTGTIRNGDKLYRVRSLGKGVTAVIEVDKAKLPPEHPPAFDKRSQERKPYPQLVQRRGATAAMATTANRAASTATSTLAARAGSAQADMPGGGGAGGAAGGGGTGGGGGGGGGENADTACDTIDVLVAYTPAAAAQSGSIDGLVQLAVDETNASYARSGIQPRLRLVRTLATNYVEDADMQVDVDRLANPADGFLDEVPTQRDAAAADIAVLITGNGNFCGIAHDIMATPDGAYAVVGQNCATGYYSFGHEIGHLQGARHNPEADDLTLPFAYGHGYFSVANRKRTVMSYDCPVGCTRIDAWATPSVTVDGIAMGDATVHNDARVINETACTVASFRQAAVTPVATGGSTTGGTAAPSPALAPTPTTTRAPGLSPWSALALLALGPLALSRRPR